MLPKNKPQATRNEVIAFCPRGSIKPGGMYIVLRRGHFLNTMGKVGQNDRRLYDDGVWLITDNVFMGVNANVDPAGSDHKDGAPTIQPGVYPSYRIDFHGGKYLAVCQRVAPVKVLRDKTGAKIHEGMFGINIHCGGVRTVGSEGCTTIPPHQWDDFIMAVINEAARIWGARELHTGIITVIVTENK